jgi:hypothetical protein
MIPAGPRLLARYLPPFPDGVVSAWLESQIPKGSWVIDPFGASPHSVLEAAQAGYRVLVAVNNPVARFLLEFAAHRASQAELQAALSELASTHRGEERMEPHIRSLYQTTCAACGQSIMAEGYLWEKGADTPYSRIYQCPHCGDEGEHAVNDNDIRLAGQFASTGLHRARALERVCSPDDPDRTIVNEALSHYPSRAVYILFTLINRLDGLTISTTRRQQLRALLIHACDMGNTLWSVSTSRPRPRQLATPSRFRENNIWLALEQGIEICGQPEKLSEVPLVSWPAVPPLEGGICLFEGRLKDLSRSLGRIPIDAVVCAIPRQNQAYWTLSALWAGWLWGKDAVGPFRVVLRRRQYDWAWHTAALHSALQHLAPALKSNTPFFGVLSETEAGFLNAALIASDAAGFALEGIALSEEHAQAQILWKKNLSEDGPGISLTAETLLARSIRNYLTERGEPASFLVCSAAGMQALADHRFFWQAVNPVPQSSTLGDSSDEAHVTDGTGPSASPELHRLYTSTNATVRRSLINRSEFINFRISDKSSTSDSSEKSHPSDPESGLYWLYEATKTNASLADRVEMAIVRYLTQHPHCSLQDIQREVFASFSGLLTPNEELIRTCLESYGESIHSSDDDWQLRVQDQPAQRRQDLSDVQSMLTQLGNRLGMRVLEKTLSSKPSRVAIGWLDAFEQPMYWFYPIVSAVISEMLLLSPPNDCYHVVVLPGSRANLIAYKLNRDPRLAERCKPPKGWRFLKFRHLRWQIENPLLTRENLTESLDLDPLTYSTSQLRLL